MRIAEPSAPVAKALAVVIPEALTVVRVNIIIKLSVTVSDAADVVTLVPPVIVSDFQ
jgi:hypothetical protein